MTTSTSEGHALYRRWLEELWGDHPGAAEQPAAEGSVGHRPGREVHGREGAAAVVAETRDVFAGPVSTVQVGPLAEGDLVAARRTGRGTTPGGGTVESTGTDLRRIGDGRVLEYRPATVASS